jgi:hypothetical protein
MDPKCAATAEDRRTPVAPEIAVTTADGASLGPVHGLAFWGCRQWVNVTTWDARSWPMWPPS